MVLRSGLVEQLGLASRSGLVAMPSDRVQRLALELTDQVGTASLMSRVDLASRTVGALFAKVRLAYHPLSTPSYMGIAHSRIAALLQRTYTP